MWRFRKKAQAQLAAHPVLLTRSFESAVTGLGSETVMRVPQTEQ
jgi:hypothetical protein